MSRKVKFNGHEITEAAITHVSLVRRGANRAKFALIKAENVVVREVAITKSDDERRLVYGVVYEPNVPDTYGDFMTPAEIEKAAHRFLAKGGVRNVDHEHNLKDTGSTVVESFIARDGDTAFPVGAWVVGAHVPDPKLWAMVKSGEITGFSMYGAGVRTPSTIEVEKHILLERNLVKEKSMQVQKSASGNFQPPATPGEQQSDTDAQVADRARVASQMALERGIVELEDEFRAIASRPGVPEVNRQRVLYDLQIEISSLRRVLADLKNPQIAKSASTLDLLCDHGIATAFNGNRVVARIPDAPSRISKEEKAAHDAFWGEVGADGFGLRRR